MMCSVSICLGILIFISGSSFILPSSQANTSPRLTNSFNNTDEWDTANCSSNKLEEVNNEWYYFRNRIASILKRVHGFPVKSNVSADIKYVKKMICPSGPIEHTITNDYKYIQTNASFVKLLLSTMSIKKINSNFIDIDEGTVQIYISLERDLTLEVNFTNQSKLMSKIKLILRNVVISITTNLKNNSYISTNPVYKHFDYAISIRNTEQSDFNPPIDELKSKMIQLIKSVTEYKISNEMNPQLVEIYKQYRSLKLSIECLPRFFGQGYSMRYFTPVKTSDSKTWRINKIDIDRWPDFQSIQLSYFENSLEFKLKLGNCNIIAELNLTEADREIMHDSSEYKFISVSITLKVNEKKKIYGVKVDFKESVHINETIKNVLQKSIESCLTEDGSCYLELLLSKPSDI